MEILDAELTVTWLSGAQISWVGSVVAEPSEGGYVQPVSRQARPLLHATFSSRDAIAVQTMFFNTDCGRKAFFLRPPLERLYKFTGVALGIATGSSQAFQLTQSVGSISWAALYPDESSIILYANGSPISESDWSQALGLVTLDADGGRSSQAITADYEIRYAVRFVEEQLNETVEVVDYEVIQSLTVSEIF